MASLILGMLPTALNTPLIINQVRLFTLSRRRHWLIRSRVRYIHSKIILRRLRTELSSAPRNTSVAMLMTLLDMPIMRAEVEWIEACRSNLNIQRQITMYMESVFSLVVVENI
jgi:hypothetical protein